MDRQTEVFEHMEFGTLEIVMIEDRPYFPAVICAEMLGYKRPERVITRFCTGQVFISIPNAKDIQREIHIPESDLYRLIIRSKHPAVAIFEEWICSDVFPSLRRSGACFTRENVERLLERSGFFTMIGPILQYNTEINAELQEKIKVYEAKLKYINIVMKNDNAVPISVIAKDYGVSAIELNRILSRLAIQFKVGTSWVLYQRYADAGYTLTRTISGNDSQTIVRILWTQKGRIFLYETLEQYGMLPLVVRDMEARV